MGELINTLACVAGAGSIWAHSYLPKGEIKTWISPKLRPNP